jgi:hypothetical protein
MNETDLVLGILVLGLLIYRQFIARPVRDAFRLPLILAVIGIVGLISFLKGKNVDGALMAGLVGSLVLAAVFGGIRAMFTKVWIQDGRAWRKGGVIGAVLWVVTLAVHLGYDQLVYSHSQLGNATILLYLAVSLVVQGLILEARAQRLPAAQDVVMEPIARR